MSVTGPGAGVSVTEPRVFGVAPQPPLLAGPGTLAALPERLGALGLDTAGPVDLVCVTDRGLRAAGLVDRLLSLLSGRVAAVVDDVPPNPTLATVRAALAVVRGLARPVALVGFGGGSVLDVTKAVALVAAHDGEPEEFAQATRIGPDGRVDPASLAPARVPVRPALPWAAVPTTSGTGSETNGSAVLVDEGTGRKTYLSHELAKPSLVVLDAELTLGLPPSVTAHAGMDAVAHATEALASTASHPYADALAAGALATLRRDLPVAVRDGSDLATRHRVQVASHLAGLSFATGPKLGLAHGLAHPLSARLGTPHGQALASVLPAVVAFNSDVVDEPYAVVSRALGASGSADDAAPALADLAAAVGTGQPLAALGVTEDLLEALAADALADRILLTTPRQPTHEQAVALYRSVL